MDLSKDERPGPQHVRAVAIVAHTHWDREWYEPFQTFRMRLVEMLDDLLPRLEADPSYAHFLLDGQLAVVDDYLAVRPEAEERLRRLVASTRVSIGPWYVLPDEFLVSGETLIRNLEAGMRRAAGFGGAMEVGYLPDMFGHVAQMPQILRQAGFEHAVVWRGVPSAVDKTAFWWTAPDGSTVRAEYLPVGYGNGAAVPDDAKQLISRVRAHEAELSRRLPPGVPLLWMNGTDHQAPQPWLGAVVAEANAVQDDYRLEVTSLTDYLDSATSDGLPACTGELRSGASANLLMGVASNRIDVKQAAARAERSLERRAEPLCALFLPVEGWPDPLLETAWLLMLRNAAHDSVCACSADEVVDAVLHRYSEVSQIGDGLASQALRAVGRSSAVQGPLVVNPAARTRGGVVELVLGGDVPTEGAQVLWSRPALREHHSVPGNQVSALLSRIANGAFECGARLHHVVLNIEERQKRALSVLRSVEVHTGLSDEPAHVTSSALCEAYARGGAHGEDEVEVDVLHDPFQRVLARVDNVPGFGWQAWSLPRITAQPARAEGHTMSNGLIDVTVDSHDGTFAIDGLAGLDRLVDGGDAGDTYNYSPPSRDAIVDVPVRVEIDVVETGPVRATLGVTRTYEWPERVVDGERTGSGNVHIHTRLQLHAGERLVRVTTSFDNQARDHRLRALFPLPEAAINSSAECAFSVVERGLTTEGGPHERALPTFPCRRFVSASGLTVVHEGLLEYELVDGGRALALTLLRCTGLLSGTDLTYRPMPAGPPVKVGGAQMIGPQTVRYGVAAGVKDPYELADQAFLPLEVTAGSGTGDLPQSGSALEISGAEVSAVRRVAGQLEVRLFNPSDADATVDVSGRRGWLVDLRGRVIECFEGSLVLAPWKIATLRLADRAYGSRDDQTSEPTAAAAANIRPTPTNKPVASVRTVR